MPDPINISNLPLFQQAFAKECDKDGNGILEKTCDFDEISLFNEGVNKIINGENSIFTKKNVAEPDATRVDKSVETSAMELSSKQNIKLEEKNIAKPIENNININSKAELNKNITYDTEILNKALNNVLKKTNSKLNDTAETFLEYAKSENVDPLICMAIAMHESTKGTSWAAINRNNIGGIADPKKTRKARKFVSQEFKSVQDSIKAVVQIINERIQVGNKTINSIAHSGKYCAKSSASNWANNVSGFAEQLRQEYNRLLQEKMQ